jgi:hypothetical protein
VKTVERFVDEISGKDFKTQKEAISSEIRHGGIKKLFDFWKPAGDFKCDNDRCFQRSDVDYLRLQDALVKAVVHYEPWIDKHYKKEGGMSRKYMQGGFIIGRFLSDGNSDLYKWYCVLSNICTKCFREFNQPYGANHCTHNNEAIEP